jgi:hypothetical protein
MKSRGYYIAKDGSIEVKPVNMKGTRYEAVLVLPEDSDASLAYTALKHLTEMTRRKVPSVKRTMNSSGVLCPKCQTRHDVSAYTAKKDFRVLLVCPCGYQMRIRGTPILKYFGPKIDVT